MLHSVIILRGYRARENHVHELSFDENCLLIKLTNEFDFGGLHEYPADNFQNVLEKYVMNTELFSKRFRRFRAGR